MGYKTYGMVRGNQSMGARFPVAASQYFHHGYGGWVEIDTAGHILVADSDSEKLFGWAQFPESGVGAGAVGSAYWLSSASAGEDELFVQTDLSAWFSMPLWTGGAIDVGSQARVGEKIGITYTNGTTAGQEADLNNTRSDNILLVKDWDSEDTSIIIVQINVLEMQVDQT